MEKKVDMKHDETANSFFAFSHAKRVLPVSLLLTFCLQQPHSGYPPHTPRSHTLVACVISVLSVRLHAGKRLQQGADESIKGHSPTVRTTCTSRIRDVNLIADASHPSDVVIGSLWPCTKKRAYPDPVVSCDLEAMITLCVSSVKINDRVELSLLLG